jgi:hypothetical protein
MNASKICFTLVMVIHLAFPGCRTVRHYGQDEIVAAVLEVSSVLRNNETFSEDDCKTDIGKALFTRCTDLDRPIPLHWVSVVEKARRCQDCSVRVASRHPSASLGVAFIYPFGIPLPGHALMVLGTYSPPNVSFYSFARDGRVYKLNCGPDDDALLYDLMLTGATWDANSIVWLYGRLAHAQQDRVFRVKVSQERIEILQ